MINIFDFLMKTCCCDTNAIKQEKEHKKREKLTKELQELLKNKEKIEKEHARIQQKELIKEAIKELYMEVHGNE